MKNTFRYYLLSLWILFGTGYAQDTLSEAVRQAIRETMPQVTEAVKQANTGSDRAVTLVPAGVLVTNAPPFSNTDAYLESQLKNSMTAAGVTMAEPVDRNVWENAVATIEVQERKGSPRVGVLDPAYLNSFGKLRLAQRLLTFELVDVQSTPTRVMVEFTLHLYDLETNLHIWGQTFVRRVYLQDDVRGIVELDRQSREVLKAVMDKAKVSLSANRKAKAVGSVVILPMAGDVDRYVTQLARDAVSQAGLTPRELPLNTGDEARALLRNTPDQVDAALIGAVRELYREELPDTLEEVRYKIMAEVQVALLQAGTLDVLWSDTLSFEKEFADELPPVEMQIWDVVKQNPRYVLYVLGGLALLLVLLKMINGAQRVK